MIPRISLALSLALALNACRAVPTEPRASLAGFGLAAHEGATERDPGVAAIDGPGRSATEQDIRDELRERGESADRPRLALVEVVRDGPEQVAASLGPEDLAAFETGWGASSPKIQTVPGFLLPRRLGWTDLRYCAARSGADHLVILTRATERERYANGWSVLYLTIVGCLIVPGHTVEVWSSVEAAYVDVKTGRVLAVASAGHRSESSHLLITAGPAAEREDVRENHEAMLKSLGDKLSRTVPRP